MEELKIIENKTLNLSLLEKVQDLISFNDTYYEGLRLSLYKNKYEDYYLYFWCESNSNSNRWLIFTTPTILLKSYIDGNISLLELIKNSSDNLFFIKDLDNNLNVINEHIITFEDIPINYLPAENEKFNNQLWIDSIDNKIIHYLKENKTLIKKVYKIKNNKLNYIIYLKEDTDKNRDIIFKIEEETNAFFTVKVYFYSGELNPLDYQEIIF